LQQKRANIEELPESTSIELVTRLRRNIERALMGKREAVDLVLTSLLARGHVLIEDVPGVGKTTLARALARSVNGTFRRIQFTSDLLPADIIGTSVFLQERGEFEFRRGPIFANVVLADEINRTTPKTQSCLLEAMNEGQVSVDGVTHQLGEPFIVAATQNPHEFYGTYPLPESQLDRFMFRINLGYPELAVERTLLRQDGGGDLVDGIGPVVELEEVIFLQESVTRVRFDEALLDYLLEIVKATRESSLLELGLSPRAALMLRRATRAFALIQGREYAVPDDIKRLLIPAAAHRILPIGQREGGIQDRQLCERILRDILETISIPV
jgi:MoxR-like ATPase